VKVVTPFRIASGLLVVFCVMHTLGGMLAQQSLGPDSDTVFGAMKRVHFFFNGADSTWYGFWLGFGLTVSVFLLLSAVMAWTFERIPRESWPHVSVVAWALIVSHAIHTVLAWKYFFAGPGVFGILITGLLIAGTIRKQRANAYVQVAEDS
jgi:hypothetical protein